MKLKNLSSVILAAMMAATSVPAASLIAPYNSLSAYAVETAEPEAEAPIASGLCGENLTWEVFDEEDSLVIDGTGAMTEWEKAEDAPWAEYGDRISLIVIRENVESVSENAFGATGGRIFYFDGFDCVIPDSETFLPENASIHGYDNSTAQAYAEKYGREFTSEGEYEAPSDENISTDENVPSDEEDSTVIEENRIVAEGMCGENLKWEIDSLEDILIISGYGEMTDWEKPEDAPWFEYSDEFDIVIIRPGVGELSENSLGSNAKIIYLESYNCVIPDSETVIPADAKILGYTGSTAQAYAEKYGREFDTLSGENEEYPLMEGVCTENLKWILWDDGSLAFYGYGDIVAENGVYPWDVAADSIKEVIISTAVKSIDENAFTNCTNLESVLMYTPDCQIADSADVFPSNVLLQVGDNSTAEEYAVKYNLTHVVYNFFTASGEIGDNLTWVLFSGGSLRIYGEGDMIDLGGVSPWAEYEDEITRVQIDEEVTSIDKSAFEGCDNIAEMIVLNPECKFAESEDAIPEDTVIYAAEGSGALMYAQLFGRSFKTLSSEITAPEEEESPIVAEGELGDNLKWNLNKNGDLSIEGTGEMPDCGKGGYPWSEYADQIKGVYFEKEVTSIGSYAFYNCTNLETMYLAPVIGEHAYDGCINVNGYSTYGDLTVNVIGDYAFNNCGYDVYEIDNPDCVIADSKFVFPVNATIWGYAGSTAQAHAEKYGLEFVEIKDNESYEGKCGETLEWNILSDNRLVINGDGVMDSYVGYSNWEEYTELFDTVEYSGELYNYGEYAFYNCKNLKSIELAPVIGAHAFEGCSNITSTITSGEFVLKEIGDYAFYGCDNLGGLIIENPECVIADSPYVFPEDMTIFGVAGSTAQAYAEKYGLEFVEIEYEEVYEGTCGEAINWSFDENTGYLWLRGEGVMNNWESADIVPWAEYADKITNISIDGWIESIGDYAFSGLTNLRSVQTEGTANQIARIGEHAFDGCTSLESTIFYNVEEIQDYAFYGCDSLEHLYFSSENCTVADSPNVFPEEILISGTSDDLKAYAEKYNFKYDDCSVLAEGKLDDNYTWTLLNNGSLSIDATGDMPVLDGESPWSEYADKVKFVFFDSKSGSIGDYAFYNFKNLEGIGFAFVDVDFMSIGSHAFENCEKLAYFTAFENITEIGDYAFNGCDSLEVVYIRNSDCVIADSEFVFPANTEIHGYAGSTAQAYAEKYGLEFVEITSGEQEIVAEGMCGENVSWAIYEDEKSLIISGEGEMANWETTDAAPWAEYSDFIEAVCINDGVKSIGENSFDALSNIWQFISYSMDCVIPDSDTAIPENAEILCYNGSTAQAYAEKYGRTCVFMGEIDNDIIVSGELGEGFEWTIYDNGKITINGVGEMPEYEAGNYPWSDYSDMIKNISLAKEVTSIGAYAFYNCTNLIDVGLEDCINIGEHAFEGCENLSYIFIWGNENTIEIGDYAFYGCDALENVFLRGDSFNIADSPNVFPEGVIIEGRCDGAKAYAEKYNIEYDDLSTKVEGNLTDTASWIIYNNNDLDIWGEGIIPDSDGYNPWSEYADDIKNIFINNEIVYIGDYAFYNCKNAETIVCYGVYSTEAHVIGNHAFDGCEKLKEFIAHYEFVEIGDYAFYNCDSMEDIFIYNPECVIADSEFVFPANTVIHGYAGSTAQAHAEKYGLDFVIIEEESVTTTAPDSDSETTTTTTTTTPNDSESELPQTGFSKAYDYLAFSAGVMALCGIYAMKKSKKKEDEE